jgi:hypothetical protein
LNEHNSFEELAIQKEQITKKHFEADKFYEMLVQSANDGISFYDRELYESVNPISHSQK